MTSHKRRAMILYAQVYRDRENTRWLGFMDDGYLTGTRLMTVLCQGAKAETFAYGTLGPLEAIEGFWEQYKQMGRCVVDPEHKIAFIGDEDRWSVEGDSRSCSWCGQVHHKLVTRVETITHQHWENTYNGGERKSTRMNSSH